MKQQKAPSGLHFMHRVVVVVLPVVMGAPICCWQFPVIVDPSLLVVVPCQPEGVVVLAIVPSAGFRRMAHANV
jgi:hypothetical protein